MNIEEILQLVNDLQSISDLFFENLSQAYVSRQYTVDQAQSKREKKN